MLLRTFQRRIAGNINVARIFVSARDDIDTAQLQTDVERFLRERRNIGCGAEDDFTVRDTKQLGQTMSGTTAVLTGLLGAVAAVSLLVAASAS